MKNFGLWTKKECPDCGEEYDVHKEGCNYLKLHKQREDRAKKALADFGPETIDDLVSLIDMRNGNSLHGDIWRQISYLVESLDMQITYLEMTLKQMQTGKADAEKLVKKLESSWFGERQHVPKN